MAGSIFRKASRALVAAALLAAPLSSAGADDFSQGDAAFAPQAVSDSELSESRGAFIPGQLNLASANLNASSSHNVVIGGQTGTNVIGNGSFSNTHGLINVIQNTGNNVIIQSSTIVNLSFAK